MSKEITAAIAGLAAGLALTRGKAQAQGQNVTIGDNEPISMISGLDAYIESLEYRDMVWVDAAAVGGSIFPAGTPEQSCKTLAEGRTVAAAHNIKVLHLKGFHTVDADMIGYTFIMDGLNIASGNQLTCDPAFSINLSTIKGGCIGGVPYLASIDNIVAVDCQIGLHNNPITVFGYNNLLTGNAAAVFVTGTTSLLVKPYTIKGLYPPVDFAYIRNFDPVVGNLTILGLNGYLNIFGQTAVSNIIIDGEGIVQTDVTSTFGIIELFGDIEYIDGAGGAFCFDKTTRKALSVTLPAAIAGVPASITFPYRAITYKPAASAITQSITITTGAADKSLGSIIITGIKAGGVVSNVLVWVSIGAIENNNAAVNNLDGAQYIKIQKGAGAFTTCIALPSGALPLPATTKEGGRVFLCTSDMSAVVDSNATYTLKLANGLAAQNNLMLYDIQWGLIVEYDLP